MQLSVINKRPLTQDHHGEFAQAKFPKPILLDQVRLDKHTPVNLIANISSHRLVFDQYGQLISAATKLVGQPIRCSHTGILEGDHYDLALIQGKICYLQLSHFMGLAAVNTWLVANDYYDLTRPVPEINNPERLRAVLDDVILILSGKPAKEPHVLASFDLLGKPLEAYQEQWMRFKQQLDWRNTLKFDAGFKPFINQEHGR